MKYIQYVTIFAFIFVFGLMFAKAQTVGVNATSSPQSSLATTTASRIGPSEGWDIHYTAVGGLGKSQNSFEHYCKVVYGKKMIQCQIYESGSGDARMVGTEFMIDPSSYNKLNKNEKALWHSNKDFASKHMMKLPKLSSADSAKFLESFKVTYGKTYVFWSPEVSSFPFGFPNLSEVSSGSETVSSVFAGVQK